MEVEIHLESMSFEKIIVNGNNATDQDRVKAMMFLRYYLDEGLKTKYLMIKNLLDF